MSTRVVSAEVVSDGAWWARGRRPRVIAAVGLTVTALALLVLMMVTGCGGSRSATGGEIPDAKGTDAWPSCETVTEPIITASATMYGSSPTLESVTEAVDQLGRERFTEVFAGLVVRAECDRLFVYRLPSADFDAAVRATPGAHLVTILDAEHSLRQLQVWQDRITDDMQRGSLPGVNGVGAQFDGSCLVVFATDVDQARSGLAGRYPDLDLCVQQAGPMTAW